MKLVFSSANSKLLFNFTFANFLTAVRLCLAPVIFYYVILGQQLVAFALFFLASLTDFLDGYWARKTHTISLLGGILDPLADKFLVAFIYAGLAYAGKIPLWLATLVLLRDVLILLGIFYIYYRSIPLTIMPIISSKINTFFQLLLCVTLLLPFHVYEGFIQGLIYVTFISTVYSGGAYAGIFIKTLRK